MDAASNNSVDDIRDLREKVGFAPALGGWKVYILDEAHMLSTAAWNAFLKTLEEPPPNTIFVLATTEAHKVLATIVDRCHRFDFQRPSLEEITTVLRRIADAEQIEADDRTLAMIARSAAGSFRDAIGTLDQLVTYGGKQVAFEDVLEVLDVADAELIFKTTDALVAHDPRAALECVEELITTGPRPAAVHARPDRPPAPARRRADDRRGARHVQRHGRPDRASRSTGAGDLAARGRARDRPRLGGAERRSRKARRRASSSSSRC